MVNLTNITSGGVVNASANGLNYTRNDTVNMTAVWVTDRLINATVQLNRTTAWANYTVSNFTINVSDAAEFNNLTANFTNFTINLSNSSRFLLGGNYSVHIFTEDTYGQVNASRPVKYFNLVGHANVTGISFDYASILNGTSTNLYCNVTDANSSAGIPDYNTSFYRNGTFVGSNTTNSSGISRLNLQDNTNLTDITNNSIAQLDMNCNITANVSIYYDYLGTSDRNRTLFLSNISGVALAPASTGNVYNRGENITVYVNDSAGNPATGVSYFLNLTRPDNTSEVYSVTNDTWVINITPSSLTGAYMLVVNSSRLTHAVNTTLNITVSSTLKPVFLTPSNSSSVEVSKTFDGASVPKLAVQTQGGKNITQTVNMTLDCPTNAQNLVNMSLVSGVYQNTTMTNTVLCTGSGLNSVTYYLTANITGDPYNNTGLGYLAFTTVAASTSVSGGVGGGGGAICKCTEWVFVACGLGNCKSSQIQQTRVCTPAACKPESQCVEHPVCEGIDFNFTVSGNISMQQGGNGTAIANVFNPTDYNMSINVSTYHECCEMATIKEFYVGPRDLIDFPIEVHAPLNQTPGTYAATINLTTEVLTAPIRKSRSIELMVEESPLAVRVSSMRNEVNGLLARAEEYRISGLDVSGLLSLVESIGDALDSAEGFIEADNLEGLSEKISLAEESLTSVQQGLDDLATVKLLNDNRFVISGIVVFFIIVYYLMSQVAIPYHKMSREISRLTEGEKSLVKTRVETQKQYFMRKVDEATFNRLMIETQGKVHKARGTLAHLQEERSTLLKRRLRPQHIAEWARSGAKKITGRKAKPAENKPINNKGA